MKFDSFSEHPLYTKIMVGSHSLAAPGPIYNVSKILLHPKFWKPRFANDIALLKIDGNITFNELVKPIELNGNHVTENKVLLLSKSLV